jgi:hypothetical protein
MHACRSVGPSSVPVSVSVILCLSPFPATSTSPDVHPDVHPETSMDVSEDVHIEPEAPSMDVAPDTNIGQDRHSPSHAHIPLTGEANNTADNVDGGQGVVPFRQPLSPSPPQDGMAA